jgi:palmitoyl-protein thioesterase
VKTIVAKRSLDDLKGRINDILTSSKDVSDMYSKLADFGLPQLIHLQNSSPAKALRGSLKRSVLKNKDDAILPVIQMHGMGDFANDPFGMIPLRNAISDYLGGVYVLNVQIGENSIQDILNGFFMNLDDQVDYFANVIRGDPNLANGFNAVGYSQGNLVIRGYIERYNHPPIKNFISMHGPLAGVGAFPGCSIDKEVCRLFSEILGALAYFPRIQDGLTQANYFRDPMKVPEYQAKARFLPDINNEDTTPQSVYSSNWASLESVCLVKALGDTVVIPNDSEWFGFFEDGSFDKIWSFQTSPWYQGDYFGLKTLDQAGKVYFNTTDGNHLDFETDYLLDLVGTYFT